VSQPVSQSPASSRPPSGFQAAPDGALAGLKVVDLTWSVAGPALTRTLADFGATVVKVESTSRVDAARTFVPFWHNQAGLERSALFDNLNAGKHSITLNIASEAGHAVLDDLLRWADVVVDSFSPRGRIALGLDDERVRALNPSIINLSVTLFGLDGPLAELAGYGNLGGALAGCYDITGWPDRAPAGPYLAYTDYTSAHLMVATLMAAVHHRQRTGEGQFIELSQSETALQYLAPALVWTAATGELFTRMGNDDLELAPHGVYPAAADLPGVDQFDDRDDSSAARPVDDRWVAVACPSDEVWPALAGAIGRPDLAADPALATAAGRRAARRQLDEAVSAWTARRPAADATDALQAVGVAACTVQTSADCVADPQLAHRGHIVRVEHPQRECIVEGTRCILSRTPGRPRAHAPSLGEHNFEVLSDLLGYDADRIAELAAAEILE
jgi:benzylsuccinate CoA-transferase BbsF subunit